MLKKEKSLKQLAIAITGPSGSGKTTLIEKIARELIKDYKVAIIKHDPKDKAIFDNPTKDSGRFFQTGADVAVVSNRRTTLFKHQSSSLNELATQLSPFDLLIVEGLKTWDLPRIAVFRNEIEESYLPYVFAVAVDSSISHEKLAKLDKVVLDLNNTKEIIDYIFTIAKEIKGA